MNAEIQGYLDTLEALRGQVRSATEGLSAAAINWRPLPQDTNSIYAMVTHMCGTEGFWVHRMAGGLEVPRNRDAEFAASGQGVAALEVLLERTGRTTVRVLGGLDPATLDKQRDPGGGRPHRSVRWCILHTIDHLALHLGHLQLTKQMYEARTAKG